MNRFNRSRMLAAGLKPHIIATLGVLLVLAIQQALFYQFFIDDSYISLVYVKNWLHGNGLTYNGLVVEGYSNFLWVVSLCLIGLFQIDVVLAAKWLGIVCAAGTLVAMVVLGHTLTARWRVGLMAALLLTLCGPFVAWSVGGLETCLFTLLLVLFVLALVREQAVPNRWWLSAVWGVLLALTRPEGIGLVAVAWVWLVANGIVARDRARLRASVRWTLLVAGGFGLFLLWRYLRYGDLLPSTVYAKSGSLRDQLYAARIRLLPLVSEWSALVASFVIGAISCVLLLRRAWRAVWLLLMLLSAYGLFVVLSGADWMPMHRFVVPLLPLIAILTSWGFDALALRLPPRWQRAQPWLFVILLVPCCLQVGIWTEHQRVEAIAIGRSSFEPNIGLGEMIRSQASSQTKIAVVDAGALAYYSEVPTLDLFGLNNRYIARLPGGFGTRFDANYILAYQPNWVVTHYETTPSGIPRFIDFDMMYKLYYTREFQRWYAPDPTLPFAPFRRLAQPRDHTMMDHFYASAITLGDSVGSLHAGQPATLPVRISNQGTGTWRNAGKLEVGAVYLRAQLFDPRTAQQIAEQWSSLPRGLQPGETADIVAHINLPRDAGNYRLRLDLVLNGVAYFAEEGGSVSETDVTVQ